MFRTAVPFGYLFYWLFILGALFCGAAMCFFGRRSRSVRWFGGGVAAVALSMIGAEVVFDLALEWNPTIGADTEIVGKWKNRTQTVELNSNRMFTYRTPSEVVSGTWSRNDWNLYLHGNGYSGQMRFVQFFGRKRLMTQPPEDPDMWDGEIGLKQISSE